MDMKKIFIGIIILFNVLILTSCSLENNTNSETKPEGEVNQLKDDTVNLNVWTYFPGMEPAVEEFERINPNIKVNLKKFNYHEYEMEYKKSIVSEKKEVDVLFIENNHYGEFNGSKGLENLLEPKYSLMDYKDGIDGDQWELAKSFDKKEVLGIPIASSPMVTYYRADIMKKYGFPSDPHELATYMEDSENWLKIANTLAKDGIYTLQWDTELIKVFTNNIPFFNEKLEYQKANDNLKEAIKLSKKVRDNRLAPSTDIWSDKGKNLLKEDKFAMLYLGSWGSLDIESIAPEQSGKWRVTKLPFGQYGSNSSVIASITEKSEKKDAAWKFIKFFAFEYDGEANKNGISSYIPLREKQEKLDEANSFLAGQQYQKFFLEIMPFINEYPVTEFDYEAFLIADELIIEGLDRERTEDEIINNIRNEIERTISREREILLKKMEEN